MNPNMSLEDIERIIDESTRKLAEKEEERRKFAEYIADLDKIFDSVKRESIDLRSAIAMYILDALKQILPPADLAPILLTALAEVTETLKMHKRLAAHLAPIVLERMRKLEEMR